ncbi:hypothetical protein [Draconibacterium orientale]|uniref:hypothetical protein n=1 Tax=Draconibacterium orientale TaxID=1168034 RepID=UPI0029BFF5A8|nr:hypothetical protein [Draconibacterium orientale]
METKYFKIGMNYVAVDYENKKVYVVTNKTNELEVKIWTGDKEVRSIAKYRGRVEIDEATFSEKFSTAVDRLHNETPFA